MNELLASMNSIDTAESLRVAMRGLAKSVTLVSTVDRNGQRHVMAATAVSSISMAPPSMLFCIDRTASAYPAFRVGSDFCINILAADQLRLAHHCSVGAKGAERFNLGEWSADEAGTPYLTDAQASVFCYLDQRQPYGSHDVVFGLVKGVKFGRGIDPLVYANGAYKRLAVEALAL